MDRAVIEQKLEALRRCLQRIEKKRPATVETLQADEDVQDILTLNLTRAVQLCVDIGMHIIADLESTAPATMGETFDVLSQTGVLDRDLADQMKKAVGFRNVAVHNYGTIDWTIVHTIASLHVADFGEFAKAISRLLDQDS